MKKQTTLTKEEIERLAHPTNPSKLYLHNGETLQGVIIPNGGKNVHLVESYNWLDYRAAIDAKEDANKYLVEVTPADVLKVEVARLPYTIQ